MDGTLEFDEPAANRLTRILGAVTETRKLLAQETSRNVELAAASSNS
jgi:hypothetical protein